MPPFCLSWRGKLGNYSHCLGWLGIAKNKIADFLVDKGLHLWLQLRNVQDTPLSSNSKKESKKSAGGGRGGVRNLFLFVWLSIARGDKHYCRDKDKKNNVSFLIFWFYEKRKNPSVLAGESAYRALLRVLEQVLRGCGSS